MAKWTEDNVREGDSPPNIYDYYNDYDYYIDYYGDKYYGTFQGCSSLKSISIPQVKVVGARAFYGCSSLKSISIPNATSIGSFDLTFKVLQDAKKRIAKIALHGEASSSALKED